MKKTKTLKKIAFAGTEATIIITRPRVKAHAEGFQPTHFGGDIHKKVEDKDFDPYSREDNCGLGRAVKAHA